MKILLGALLLCASASSEAGLLAYYPFDGDFSDTSGNNNHLGVSSGSPSITFASGESMIGGGALNLDQSGIQEHLSFTTPFDFNGSTPWSMTWWGKRSSSATAAQGMIVGTTTDSNDFVWTPSNPANGSVEGLRLRNSTGTSADYDGIVDDSTYHHWAVVYNGAGSVEVWRDNISLGSKSFPGNITMTHVGAGTSTINNSFFGQIDELHIFNEAINAAKVNELFTAGDPEPPVVIERLRVILLGGQSNADGRAISAELPNSPLNLQAPQNDVDIFYKIEGGTANLTSLRPSLSETSQFGPEITLGRAMADFWQHEPGTRVAIIKYANGGTNLQVQWKAGGDSSTAGDGPEYTTFQQTVQQGLAALAAAYPSATIDLQGMVWMQGESDAVLGYQNQYEANLTNFIADVRATYAADLPFIVGRLSIHQTNIAASPLGTVRDAQTDVATADPRVALIDTDPFGIKSDNLHFDALGQQALGSSSAAALIGYTPFTSGPTLQRLENGDIQVTLSHALPGFLYTLENSGTLLPGEWSEGSSEIGNGAAIFLNYTPANGETSHFFRVKRSLAP